MGYRSTFVSEQLYIELPEWFYEKWKHSVHFNMDKFKVDGEEKPSTPISSKYERKFYQGASDDLFLDLAKVMSESEEKWAKSFELVLFHEDGLVDKVTIERHKITLVRNLTHDPLHNYNPQLGEGETLFLEEEAFKLPVAKDEDGNPIVTIINIV